MQVFTAPQISAPATFSSIMPCVTKGRAASWVISTVSASPQVSRAYSNASSSVSPRVSPPARTVTGVLPPERPAFRTSVSVNSTYSSGTSSNTASTRAFCRKARRLCSITASPPSVRNCFGISPPIRLPLPPPSIAATTIRTHLFILLFYHR